MLMFSNFSNMLDSFYTYHTNWQSYCTVEPDMDVGHMKHVFQISKCLHLFEYCKNPKPILANIIIVSVLGTMN